MNKSDKDITDAIYRAIVNFTLDLAALLKRSMWHNRKSAIAYNSNSITGGF